METNQIQELFDKHTIELTYTDNTMRVMNVDDFAEAINQAELELYKKLEKKLSNMRFSIYGLDYLKEFKMYHNEIQNKIKELENGN